LPTQLDVQDAVDRQPPRCRMNVHDLLTFVTIAQLESMSRAAVQLNIAQSALSRRMQRLEQDIGQKLLERHTRGVRLTEAGKILLARGVQIQDALIQIETQMRSLAEPRRGELHLAMPHGALRLFGSVLVERFTTLSPNVRLHLFERESIYNRESAIGGEVDLALAYDPEPSSELRMTPLLTERLLVVGPARKNGVPVLYPPSYSIRDLARLPLIMPGPRHGYRRIVERITRSARVVPNITLEVHGLSAITPLVQKGVGYAVSTFAHMQTAIEEGTLIAVPIESPRCEVVLAMLERQDRAPSEARALLRRTIEEVAAHLVAPKHCRVLVGGSAMPK